MSRRFSITILGSNSALPANKRHPTSQLVNVNESFYLMDCGEGTQMQFRRYGLKMQRIKAIFISHLHGDHYYGLPGLLNSLQLLGRQASLEVFGPEGLEEIFNLQQRLGGGKVKYPIHFHAIGKDVQTFPHPIYKDKKVEVSVFPLSHRIQCFGFLFKEAPMERTYLPEKGEMLGVRLQDIHKLKLGEDVKSSSGALIKASDVTVVPAEPRTYAFCTDTIPLESTIEYVRGVNCLYHESTFLESELARAAETYHSTAKQAAEIAREASVSQLILGHYSARYKTLKEHLKEARAVFPNSILSVEGESVEIN